MIRDVLLRHSKTGRIFTLQTAMNKEFLARMYPDWDIPEQCWGSDEATADWRHALEGNGPLSAAGKGPTS